VPLGAWVLHRPRSDAKIVEVSEYHETRPQVVVSVGYYDAATGTRVRVTGSNR
jgi:hypothetical protein